MGKRSFSLTYCCTFKNEIPLPNSGMDGIDGTLVFFFLCEVQVGEINICTIHTIIL